MKYILITITFLSTLNCFALFDDKTIDPFLGPYKILKNISKNCPKRLSLIGMCTLSQLDLKSTDNLDFNFIEFKGINEGKVISKNKGKIIEESDVIFKNMKVTSKKKVYFKKYKSWFKTETQLTLKKKKIVIKKVTGGKSYTEFDCIYSFDEEEYKKLIESMKEPSKS